MGKLLETYDQLTKVAEQETEKQLQVELLQKYAEVAEETLKEQGQKYTKDDVVKVASWMIEQDAIAAEEEEKIAEYDDAGRVMARAFIDELDKTAGISSKIFTNISKIPIKTRATLYEQLYKAHGAALGMKELTKAEVENIISKTRAGITGAKELAKNIVKKHPYYVAGGGTLAGGAGGYVVGKSRK